VVHDDELYAKLKSGPAVLFLGQRYLQLESDKDFFLAEILRKYGKDVDPRHYSRIFEGDAHHSIEVSLAWMQERCERLSEPQWLKTVSEFPWNSFYTSAIDTVMLNPLRSEWRELQLLFEEKYRPLDIRNRTRLHCSFLFGCVNRVEEIERPPLTKFEWLKRKQIAVSLARRLPEIVTPFGVLLIEGYAGESDWFSPEDFFPIIDQLNLGQTHVFSVTDDLLGNPYFSELARIGKVMFHKASLSNYLLMGEEAGLLRLGVQPDKEGQGRRMQIGGTFVTVPSHTWNQVSKSVIVLDDALFVPVSPLSKERKYGEFRNFLSESSVRPVWSGYQRGFAFTRDFEKKLRGEVDKRLRSKDLQNEPVVLHGQTGTGKTVALGALAYNVRKEKNTQSYLLNEDHRDPLLQILTFSVSGLKTMAQQLL
jgi:hypothetical protein